MALYGKLIWERALANCAQRWMTTTFTDSLILANLSASRQRTVASFGSETSLPTSRGEWSQAGDTRNLPVIDGDKVVCTPGGNSAVMVASVKPRENFSGLPKCPHRSVTADRWSRVLVNVISEIAGRKQYVQLTGRGIVGVDAESGNLLWIYNRIANSTANIPTPIVKGDYIFCSTGYGTGLCIQIHDRNGSYEAEEDTGSEKLQNHHGGMILVGDYIYCGHGHNRGFPVCLNMMTGEYLGT